jgi:hypothetical protein
LFMMLFLVFSAEAVPLLLNFQGRVTVDGTVFTGAGQFKFALVNDGGSQTYWSNDGTSSAGSEPNAAVDVAVSNGNYALHLGDAGLANMAALQASVFANDPIFLRIWFSDGTNGFERLGTEDHQITSVAFALKAKEAETVSTLPESLVTEAHLATALKDKLDALQAQITTLQVAIALNTAKTGITQAQMDAIAANTAKVGYTDALVSANSDVAANTAKTGITSDQANAIALNVIGVFNNASDITDNATAISAEAATARVAEAANATAISDETTRAQTAEAVNLNKIDNNTTGISANASDITANYNEIAGNALGISANANRSTNNEANIGHFWKREICVNSLN